MGKRVRWELYPRQHDLLRACVAVVETRPDEAFDEARFRRAVGRLLLLLSATDDPRPYRTRRRRAATVGTMPARDRAKTYVEQYLACVALFLGDAGLSRAMPGERRVQYAHALALCALPYVKECMPVWSFTGVSAATLVISLARFAQTLCMDPSPPTVQQGVLLCAYHGRHFDAWRREAVAVDGLCVPSAAARRASESLVRVVLLRTRSARECVRVLVDLLSRDARPQNQPEIGVTLPSEILRLRSQGASSSLDASALMPLHAALCRYIHIHGEYVPTNRLTELAMYGTCSSCDDETRRAMFAHPATESSYVLFRDHVVRKWMALPYRA